MVIQCLTRLMICLLNICYQRIHCQLNTPAIVKLQLLGLPSSVHFNWSKRIVIEVKKTLWLFCSSSCSNNVFAFCILSLLFMLVVPLPTGYLLTNSAHLKTQQAKERYFCCGKPIPGASPLHLSAVCTADTCNWGMSEQTEFRRGCKRMLHSKELNLFFLLL